MHGMPLIHLQGVRKRYGGHDGSPAVEVLHGIDLRIHAGEFVAIVGQSGSGKSTLMNILGCLDRPSAGRYAFEGRDVATLDADALAWLRRECFGFVFQGYHLIPDESVGQNVQMPAVYAGTPPAVRASRAAGLLARLGIADKQAMRPHQLSGGQQQRVSIARALMNGGRIILADEPTGALDSKSGAEVMALLHELADAGHTIVLITHDREVAAQARRVIEIRDGRIVGDSGGNNNGGSSGAAAPSAAPAEPCAAHATPAPLAGSAPALAESLGSAWRSMAANRARTALTLLGIVIGVASVIVMLAIGEGSKQRVMAQMSTLGAAIMYLSSKVPADGGPRGELTAEDLQAIAALAQVRRVMPVIGDPLPVRSPARQQGLYVFASAAFMPSMHHWAVGDGRFYTPEEDAAREPVAALGSKAARRFFPAGEPGPGQARGEASGHDAIGRRLLIGDAPFEVVGVMAERGADSGAQNYDDMVFIPYQTGRARVYPAVSQPDYVVVEAVSPAQAAGAEQEIRALLLARHGREDFGIGNAAARIQAEMAARNTMTLMLSLIAAVSLLVGGIGVMNVMLMTVKERTREIGIRMATGARQGDILRQFLVEAVLLTVTGGVAGVLLGLGIALALAASGVPALPAASAMAGAFGCAVATGLFFGFMPARAAARLDPVVALAGQ